MKMRKLPIEAIISVTNRCDARCQMCNIWQMERDEFLTAEDYRKLPNTLKNVNITGGEALLRPDIVEIVHAVYESAGKPRIILATNGFRPDKTYDLIQQMRQFVPNLGVAISLDGLEEYHNLMRGVPEAFSRATKTLQGLIDMGITDLRIGFTATAQNVSQLPLVHQLAAQLGVEFTATVAQESETYYGVNNLEKISEADVAKNFGYLVDCNLRSPVVKNWFRAYFAHGVIKFVEEGKRITACSAASDFFYLSPRGDVYPCLTLPLKLGNLRSEPFEKLWASDDAVSARQVVDTCQDCWMVCTARTELQKTPIRALSWIVKEKVIRSFTPSFGEQRGSETQ
jgi:MoaA/NifB/PqqE/SkfB family radical SAM enzyme